MVKVCRLRAPRSQPVSRIRSISLSRRGSFSPSPQRRTGPTNTYCYHSGVLLASLERSKKKWLSDGILVRYYTKPKKTKREQIVQNNPPKESMSKVGPCDVTIGPHRFDAMIYTVKDPAAQTPIPYTHRPMVHYNQQNTFQPRYHYPPPSNQQARPPNSPMPPRPPQGYTGNQPPHQRGPQHPPPSGQRPPQAQTGQQPAKPSPDPVIQMLATRAAADPELKALMRVVASSQASQEQLRSFQAHIDELNAIIKAREQQEQRQQAAAATPPLTQPATPAPHNKSVPPQPETQHRKDAEAKTASQDQGAKAPPATPSETPSKASQQQTEATGPKATSAAPSSQGTPQPETQPQTPAQAQNSQPASQPATVSVKQEPNAPAPKAHATPSGAPQPAASAPAAVPGPTSTPNPNNGSQPSPSVRPAQTPGNFQQPAPRPGPPYPPARPSPYGNQPHLQSRPQQYGSPTPYYPQNGTSSLPAPLRNYKAVVFEFTSPLTPYGSSTSGHAGSGDRYLFPEMSILEWLPAENTMLASFLIVKEVDPSTPFPLEPPADTATGRAKAKGASKTKKGDPKAKAKDSPAPGTPTQAAGSTTDTPQKPENANGAAPGTPGTPSEPPTTPANLKEYWQPVTWRIHCTSPRLLEPLTRVVKPADEVRKYMNEVMDRAERAPDGFPALRLPHEEREAFESEGTPASAANVTAAATASRSRSSRARVVEQEKEESEVENNNVIDLEEDDELLDFYGVPSGLPPLKV